MRWQRNIGLGVFCLVLAAEPVHANVNNVKTFKQAYPEKDAKATSCKVCHTVGAKLNAYGDALKALPAPANTKALTVDDFRAAEAGDADEDGATNGDELKAGTDPADPKSVPPPSPAGEQPTSALPRHPAAMGDYLASLIDPTAAAQDAAPADEGTTLPKADAGASPAPQAEYVGTETCATCHAKQHKEFLNSTHARINIPGDLANAQGCEMCHGPGSLHVDAGGGKGVGGIINPSKNPETCFACHLDKKLEFRLPHHHPVMEGKMSCADCHNAHGEDVRPWSSTTLKGVNEACFKCHKEQRGPFVFEHEALREGCTTCHKVHGSIHQAMLQIRDSNLCLRCHTQTNFPLIGDRSHSTSFTEGTCFSAGCHTAPHGSNFDDHLRY